MEHAGLNTLDYIVLATILLSGLFAIFSGFVREIYSLFNWSASYFIGTHFYKIALPFIKPHISNPRTADYAAIFVVFCVSFVILAILGQFVTRLVQNNALSAIDRSLGFVFGIMRGIILTSIVYLVAVTVLWPDINKAPEAPPALQENTGSKETSIPQRRPTSSAPHWLLEAKTRPFLAYGANALKEFIPEEVLEKTTKEYLEQRNKAEGTISKESESYK